MKNIFFLIFFSLFIANTFAGDFNAFDSTQTITQLTELQVKSFSNFERFIERNNQVFAVFDYEDESDQFVLFSCIADKPQDWRQNVCMGGKLESSRIVQTYNLPNCDSFYISEKRFDEKDYCNLCPEPIILSGWSELLTLDSGQTVFTREIKSFVGITCEELIVNQISVNKDGDFLGWLNDSEMNTFIVIAISLIVIAGIIYFVNRR